MLQVQYKYFESERVPLSNEIGKKKQLWNIFTGHSTSSFTLLLSTGKITLLDHCILSLSTLYATYTSI
jgi:hypothetical protein